MKSGRSSLAAANGSPPGSLPRPARCTALHDTLTHSSPELRALYTLLNLQPNQPKKRRRIGEERRGDERRDEEKTHEEDRRRRLAQ
ncbi:unnamed protein product, partial [Brenthis ino]